jgi:hypothetical protein
MSFRRIRDARWLRVVCAAIVLSTGCGPRDQFFHGARVLSDGSAVEVAALMPNCGCMTLRTHATDQVPTTAFGNRNVPVTRANNKAYNFDTIVLRSYLRGNAVGQTEMKFGASVVERFDWAGVGEDDRYEVRAFAMLLNAAKDEPQELPLVIPNYLDVTSTDTPCGQTLCGFGELALSKATNGRLGQNQVEARQRGVHKTNGGQLIEAVASPNLCGCMILFDPVEHRQREAATAGGGVAQWHPRGHRGDSVLRAARCSRRGRHSSSLVPGRLRLRGQPSGRSLRAVGVGRGTHRRQED